MRILLRSGLMIKMGGCRRTFHYWRWSGGGAGGAGGGQGGGSNQVTQAVFNISGLVDTLFSGAEMVTEAKVAVVVPAAEPIVPLAVQEQLAVVLQ